jgi:hypothetical protein
MPRFIYRRVNGRVLSPCFGHINALGIGHQFIEFTKLSHFRGAVLAVGKSARRALAGAALAALLGGCASTIADNAPIIGLPEGVPARPATQLDYPAVHDMPPRRADVPLSKEEQQKLEKDLVAARDSQGKKAEAIAEPGPPAAPRRVAQKKKAAPARAQAAGSNQNP